MGDMSHYDPNLGRGGLTGNGSTAPKSKPPKPVTKPKISPSQKQPKKQLQQIQKKYKGRFSRGATPTSAPKRGFVPPGTSGIQKKVGTKKVNI